MLELTIKEMEVWDSKNEEFKRIKGCKLKLEHSLISISKWEAKWHKPYLSQEAKSREEVIDYIRCMCLTSNVQQYVFETLSNENILLVNDYIKDPMTATWFSNKKKSHASSEIPTSELIYYWMIKLGIPFECQKWHLNRLMTLIEVCNEKEKKQDKMSKAEIYSRNSELNAKRRAMLNSKG